jgi:MtN3 and saliva related transmembrane protein
MTELVGWLSSLVLLATIFAQIGKQWSERSGKGVSIWLFIGQSGASIGFTVYSVLVKNWVFTVTNALMFLSALVGWHLTLRFKAQRGSSDRPRSARAT